MSDDSKVIFTTTFWRVLASDFLISELQYLVKLFGIIPRLVVF